MTDRKSLDERLALRIVLCFAAALAVANCGAVDSPSNGSANGSAAKDAAVAVTQEQFGPTLRLARVSRANGDLASAINLYRGAAAIKPTDQTVLIELGDTLVDAGSMDDAIDVYQKVDQKSDAWLGALLGLERAYLTLAEPKKALQYADQANALAPQDHRVLIGRGVALDMVGRHAEAQQSYRALLAVTPHDVAARNDLALSLAMTKQFDEAIDIMTAMARSSTATPRIRQNLALIYGLAGDSQRAAALSRVDLDAATTEANLHFFEFVRSTPN